MDHIHFWGWYFQAKDGEKAAKQSYNLLYENRLFFPFRVPFEIALLWAGIDKHWSIGILLEHVEEIDLDIQRAWLEQWMHKAGVNLQNATYRAQLAPIPSVDIVMHHRFGNHYLLIQSFCSENHRPGS